MESARVGARVGRDGAGRSRATDGEARGGAGGGVDGRSTRFCVVEGVLGGAGRRTRTGEGLLEGVGFEFETVRVARKGSSSRDWIRRGANVSSESCVKDNRISYIVRKVVAILAFASCPPARSPFSPVARPTRVVARLEISLLNEQGAPKQSPSQTNPASPKPTTRLPCARP